MTSNILSIVADTRAHVERVVEQVHGAAAESAREGEAFMKGLIETRGTGNVWSRTYYKDGIPRRESNPGRVWTGHMRDAVGSTYTRTRGGSTSSFGWVNDQEPYFLEQESGFTHEQAGMVVAGMYALQDTREHVIAVLQEKLRGIQ